MGIFLLYKKYEIEVNFLFGCGSKFLNDRFFTCAIIYIYIENSKPIVQTLLTEE